MTSDEEKLEEVRLSRFLKMISVLAPYSLGTMYFIDETLWKEKIGKGYWAHRKNHPGCSITARCDLGKPIYFLHGTSAKPRNGEPVVVAEDIENTGKMPLRQTYFGALGPYPFDTNLLYHMHMEKKIRSAKRSMMSDFEKAALISLCKENNWRMY